MTRYPGPRGARDTAGLQTVLIPVSRPNPLVVVWRWRYELVSGGVTTAGLTALAALAGPAAAIGAIAALTAVAGLIAAWPPARRLAVSRLWCVITPHRVRTGCAQAWVHNRDGKIPVVLWTHAHAFGERVWLWCRAGTSPDDLESARAQLASACWAREVHIIRSARHAHLVAVDVVRGQVRRTQQAPFGQRWPDADEQAQQARRPRRRDAA